MKPNPKISFVGGGNMAQSLIGGLVADNYPANAICVYDPVVEKRQYLASEYGVITHESLEAMLLDADCVVLAVKPQILHGVATNIGDILQNSNTLILSIAAGITTSTLHKWLQKDYAIVRCMPNTPALIQAGISALYANTSTTDSQRSLAESILRAVGTTLWVDDESLLNAVTAVSGSGPAYIFYVVEAMQSAAEAMGLSPEHSKLLSIQTAFGAAKMALESTEPAATLRERVTSKGGTTEQAIHIFQQSDLLGTFHKAIRAACDRSEQLAIELDQN